MRYKIIAGLAALILFLAFCFLQQSRISRQKNEISKLSDEITILQNKNTLCNAYLEKQNLAIRSLKLDINKTSKEPDQVEKIKKVYIEDKSCKGELDAYKKLFDSGF